jgi:hypothetical protein
VEAIVETEDVEAPGRLAGEIHAGFDRVAPRHEEQRLLKRRHEDAPQPLVELEARDIEHDIRGVHERLGGRANGSHDTRMAMADCRSHLA